ncbi:unnamed protein product [Caenorhabditis auriculariae]|uniref:Secreted protein n=1 Tax=Caenorhabditis auriculariae TaxID=2777116 RepID=A0A8S1HUQ2_9PELO|nr:unnamed protein product [Caenorhabditis auriculariae]
MKGILALTTLVAVGFCAQTSAPGGVVCNYPATGDETTENAVPIATFRTSGEDFIRPQWCITHCQDRKSIKAAMLFQPANATSAVYKVRTTVKSDRKVMVEPELKKGTPTHRDDDPFNFCVDDELSALVDAIFDKYNDIEDISEALNYYVNKPGWAFLVYDMGPPPSIIASDNVHKDTNFCMKTINKQNPDGSFAMYQMLSGLIQK